MDDRIISREFKSDGFVLKGVLHLPKNSSPPLVVGSHGLEGSSQSAKQRILSALLTKNGMAFFRFDHRGCGQSQGDFMSDTSLEKRTRDYIHAIRHILSLKKTCNALALFGSSMGGATCINSWETLTSMNIRLCGGVFCSAPLKSRAIKNIPTQAKAKRPALPLRFFKENLLFNLTDKVRSLSHILIFHGDADAVVPVTNAYDIYHQAKDPKKLIIHKNGDHQMTSKKDQMQFETETIAWYLKCFRTVN